MRKIFFNEVDANKHNGFALAGNYTIDEKDSAYVSVEDIIYTLQNEANEIAGILMTNELSPSPETETDRHYSIGRWDKLNELINYFKSL